MNKIFGKLFVFCAFACVIFGVVSQAHAEQQCTFNIPANEALGASPVEGPFPSLDACESERNYILSQDGYSNGGTIVTPCECSGSDVPANMPSSGDPQVMMAQMMGKMLGNMLAQGLKSLINSNQQEASQEQAQAERQRELEAERIQAALTRQKAFEASMQAMVNNDMKGPTPDEGNLQFKGGAVVSTGDLSFKNDSNGPFGESNGGGTLTFKTYNGPTYTPHTALQQLETANCLSQTAAQSNITPEEAKNAANQAGEAMNGGTVQADVSGCAPPPPPPAAPPPLTQDQVTLYTKLLDATNQEQQQAVRYQQKLQVLQQKLAQDKQDVTAKQQAVEQIQNQPPVPVATPAGPVTPAPQQPNNSLAEAEAALQKAQQAEASDGQALTQAKNQMQQLNQQIQQSRTCMNDAQSNPQSAGQLLGKCGG